MTAAEFKSIRTRLGLTQSELARALRLGANGERTVRRWETGKIPVTGPASVAMEYMLDEAMYDHGGEDSMTRPDTVKEVVVYKDGGKWRSDLNFDDGENWPAWMYGFRTKERLVRCIEAVTDAPIVRGVDQ